MGKEPPFKTVASMMIGFALAAVGLDSVTGSLNGGMGSMEVANGKVSGNTLNWSMDMKVPMPMTLDCEATVDGDAMTGAVKAGVFGSMPLSGKRVG